MKKLVLLMVLLTGVLVYASDKIWVDAGDYKLCLRGRSQEGCSAVLPYDAIPLLPPPNDVDPDSYSPEEKLAFWIAHGQHVFERVRDSQLTHLWVPGYVEGKGRVWSYSDTLELRLEDGTVVLADTILAFTAGRAELPRAAVQIYPGGWCGDFSSIRVKYAGNEMCPLLFAFPVLVGGREWDEKRCVEVSVRGRCGNGM